ncbi:alpha/beta hydrolase [Rhodococcus pseudokoreensis]|uniref:Alpha/beta hydrolase n=1 Tax=Rhodococcus pseudokoreensis TaxID=2811421 RepID=A0A974W9G7_9NOCA|nr:alpha/beta hydrolase [Rhodococcus pseudokoreensis]QSE93734.1 alpha/beta hydrolase [Rhodococcus pseudokoreensis]
MTTNESGPTIVIVPGLRGHVEEHWQTILATTIAGTLTVPVSSDSNASLDDRMAALDETLAAVPGRALLVAHSAGVVITAHWAQRHPGTDRIAGALLAAPPDLEAPLPAGNLSPQALTELGWTPVPRGPLPFPSIVAAGTNDPLASYAAVARLADAWGSRLVNLGEVGHLNPASGYGEWPAAVELIEELTAAAATVGS